MHDTFASSLESKPESTRTTSSTPMPSTTLDSLSTQTPLEPQPLELQESSADNPFKTDRANEDYQLWHQWKTTGHPDHLSNLLDAIEPIIHRATYSRRGSGVPEEALRAHAKILAVKAFHSYDPSRTQLNTHLTNQLQKVSRLVYKYQDITHIPEHTQLKITSYKQAKGLLAEKLGRDPNVSELSDELHWHPREIERMERSLRKVLLGSKDEAFSNTITDMPDRQQEVFHLVYNDLLPDQKRVFEASTGFGGKPVLKGDKAIGESLKLHPDQVRKLREAISQKITAYTG